MERYTSTRTGNTSLERSAIEDDTPSKNTPGVDRNRFPSSQGSMSSVPAHDEKAALVPISSPVISLSSNPVPRVKTLSIPSHQDKYDDAAHPNIEPRESEIMERRTRVMTRYCSQPCAIPIGGSRECRPTALLSVLVKQWLQAYATLPSGNALESARVNRHLAHCTPYFPCAVHDRSLGLSLYVSELHRSLCWIVVSVTALSFLMYLGSVIIPAIAIQCPYRIPLLFIPAKFFLYPFRVVKYYWRKVTSPRHSRRTSARWPSLPIKTIRDAEVMFLFDHWGKSQSLFFRHHSVLAHGLRWLQSLESNYSIQLVVAQALHGILTENDVSEYDSSFIYIHFSWGALMSLEDEDETDDSRLWISPWTAWKRIEKWVPLFKNDHGIEDAILARRTRVVKSLVHSGVDINTQGGYSGGYTLGIAISRGQLAMDIVRLLVENGADINAWGGEDQFALQAAVRWRRWDIVRYLVENGADVNRQMSKEYGTVLQAAAFHGYLETVRWGHLDVAKFLVEQGADIHTQGVQFGSALQAAAYRRVSQIVKYIVENGGDVNARGRYGSALKIAKEQGNEEMVAYLKDRGAEES
ncbi:hypothetical protein D9758_011920 [Tetrapyrgos nigripes]|uniref:Ankyrin n=1 Tax=Tetrapyrgos nigripes TaxID=182062 RepID=A0A8H5D323_9AGAR|nr:hypothetical protein D9758_011920 [Tetrapyrgos nigripes]